MWPSSRAEDAESCGNHPGSTDSLTGAAKTWKTPHGFQNTDKRGVTGGGGGEFAKQVMAWQTPATDSFRSRGGERKDEQGLDQQERTWPTPKAITGGANSKRLERRRKAGGGPGGADLQEAVQHWMTPHASDTRSSVTGKITKKNSRPLCEQVSRFSLPGPQTLRHGPGCSCSARMLNPRFVELLMNTPVGFTDAGNPLASADFERWATASRRLLRALLISRFVKHLTKTA